MTKLACLVQVPRYGDDIRALLAVEGICETFKTTSPDLDSTTRTEVRLTVPASSEAEADAKLMSVLRSDYARLSSWAPMPDDWEG